MSNFSKFVGVVGVATLLTACGGGGGSLDVPDNVPKNAIKPDQLSASYIPLTDDSKKSAIEKEYDRTISHAIGEALGEAPIGRTAKAVELFEDGQNYFSLFRNIFCTTVVEQGTKKTLTLKSGNDSCSTTGALVVKFKGGSVELTENTTSTVIEFKNAHYTPWVDLDGDYFVNGKIEKITSENPKSVTYKVVSPLSFHIVEKDNPSNSLEYFNLSKYTHNVTEGDVKTMSSEGIIVGQAPNSKYVYEFTLSTPEKFNFAKRLLGLTYFHFPQAGGYISLKDVYSQETRVKQTIDGSELFDLDRYSAEISFKGLRENKSTLNWSQIVKSPK